MVQATTFDPVSRLASLTNNLSGTANDLSATFAYNPASQIASTVRTGDAYAWTGHFNTNVTGTANGLNQLTSVGPKSLTHDARGNVTAFGTKSFTYSSQNLLLTGPGSTTLAYDPAMRLYQSVSGGTTVRMAYDGLDRIAEYDGSNALQRRYVFGPGMDQPIVWYEGTGATDRRFLSSDERGSTISLTDSAGALVGTGINRYDEYGNPQSGNIGVFGYTGQAWLQGISDWYYKARVYDPELGRFLQTDPIGYRGGFNLYAYVRNNPINWTDPLGLDCEDEALDPDNCGITVGATRMWRSFCQRNYFLCGTMSGYSPLFPDPSQPRNNPGDSLIDISGLLTEPGVPCNPTQEQLENSGQVTFAGVSSSGYLLTGYGATYGTFETASGLRGNFNATSVGLGLGFSYQVGGGAAYSLADFMGGADSINVGTPLGEFSWSKGLNSSDWQLSSFGGGGDYGTSSVLREALGPLGILTAVQGSVTFDVTEISNVTCPIG